MAVRIRMKMIGRKHRPFFRVCAVDSRSPRDGRVLEELGTYDPMVPETDARTLFKLDRLQYWLGIGALPSERCKVLIKKYGPNGTHLDQQAKARERLAMPRVVPDPGAPAFIAPPPGEKAAAAPAEAAAQTNGDAAEEPSSEESTTSAAE